MLPQADLKSLAIQLILEFIAVTWNDSVALKSDYEMFTSLKSVWKLGDLWEISTLKSKSIVTLSN